MVQLGQSSDDVQNSDIQEILKERYRHLFDTPEQDKARYSSLYSGLKEATENNDPFLLKRTISDHITRNFNAVKMMKLPSFPLPTPEEVRVHEFIDSCAFKTTLSCFGGNYRSFIIVFRSHIGWIIWSFHCERRSP